MGSRQAGAQRADAWLLPTGRHGHSPERSRCSVLALPRRVCLEGGLAKQQIALPKRAEIQRVELQSCVSLRAPPQPVRPRRRSKAVFRWRAAWWRRVALQRPLGQVQRLVQTAGPAGQAGQLEVAPHPARRRSRQPCRRRRRPRYSGPASSAPVRGCSRARRRRGSGCAGSGCDGLAKVSFGLGKLAAAVQQQPQGVVAAAVQRVAPQSLLVVGLRSIGRVAILLQVQAVEEKLLVATGSRRRRAGVAGGGMGRPVVGRRRVGESTRAARPSNAAASAPAAARPAGSVHRLDQSAGLRVRASQQCLLAEQAHCAGSRCSCGQLHRRRGRLHVDARPGRVRSLPTPGSMATSREAFFGRADQLVGHEDLGEALLLARLIQEKSGWLSV